MKKIMIAVASVALLASCASTGNASIKQETEQSIQNKIIEGKTTKQEIRKMYGAPVSTTFTDGGNEIYKYTFSKTQAKASNFIPIVGIFASGATGTEKNLTVMFDKSGIVSRYSLDESAIDTNTGLFQ